MPVVAESLVYSLFVALVAALVFSAFAGVFYASTLFSSERATSIVDVEVCFNRITVSNKGPSDVVLKAVSVDIGGDIATEEYNIYIPAGSAATVDSEFVSGGSTVIVTFELENGGTYSVVAGEKCND